MDGCVEANLLEGFETVIVAAKGVSIRVFRPKRAHLCDEPISMLCQLLHGTNATCDKCQKRRIVNRISAICVHRPRTIKCTFGPEKLVVPVLNHNSHLATLEAGPFLRQTIGKADFTRLIASVRRAIGAKDWRVVRRLYDSFPVVSIGRLQGIMEGVASCVRSHLGLPSCADETLSGPLSAAVKRAETLMQEHFSEPLSSRDIADALHIDQSYLCRLFRREVGMTVTEYLTRLRIEKAKRLIETGSMAITEAAMAAGFGSLPRFYATFKRATRMPPRQWRAHRYAGSEKFPRNV